MPSLPSSPRVRSQPVFEQVGQGNDLDVRRARSLPLRPRLRCDNPPTDRSPCVAAPSASSVAPVPRPPQPISPILISATFAAAPDPACTSGTCAAAAAPARPRDDCLRKLRREESAWSGLLGCVHRGQGSKRRPVALLVQGRKRGEVKIATTVFHNNPGNNPMIVGRHGPLNEMSEVCLGGGG